MMDFERFDQLTQYTELLLKVSREAGFKLTHEIFIALKQLEYEMELGGKPFDKKGVVLTNKNGDTVLSIDGSGEMKVNGSITCNKNSLPCKGEDLSVK